MNPKETEQMVNIKTIIDGHEVTLGYYVTSEEAARKKHTEIIGTEIISAEVKVND